MNKMTLKKQEVATRRDDVMTHLLKGHKTRDIIEEITTKYEVSRSTVELDLTYSYAMVNESYDPDLPDRINKHVLKYNQVFYSALAKKDHKSCIMALNSIERLLHLTADVPLVAIQNNSLNLENMSLDELQALLG